MSYGEVCGVMQNFLLSAWEDGIDMTWSSSEVIQDHHFGSGGQ
ncbi:nitroreductase [Paenibacillus endophyticus]|uniref:Nitroreductase n=1 Tax=Paenibacillus endophyticus TaxID=1294268 RepID=A0A7W5G8B8_9BACL|nr:nitroreductase [Paenibacillus endophyticus]